MPNVAQSPPTENYMMLHTPLRERETHQFNISHYFVCVYEKKRDSPILP